MDDGFDGAAAAHQNPAPHENGNPLLAADGLPQFEALRAEHVEPAINEVLATQRAALERAERAAEPTLDWLRELEQIGTAIHRVWGPVSHLNSVLSSPALREAFNRCLPLVTEFYTDLGQNEALYRRYESLAPRAADGQHPVEAQLISHALREFRLSGVTLTGAPRERF